jgi:hypothetical protein
MATKRKTTKKKTVTRKKTARKQLWFAKARGSYIPVNWKGWLTYVPYIAYLDFTIVVVWRDISTLSMATLFIVPNWIAATVLLTWVAARKS